MICQGSVLKQSYCKAYQLHLDLPISLLWKKKFTTLYPGPVYIAILERAIMLTIIMAIEVHNCNAWTSNIGNGISTPLHVSTMIATGQGSAKCANEIRVQRGIWQKWKDFNDSVDYYEVHMKYHYMVCIRRRDTNATLAVDLVVDMNKQEREWYTRVRETEWRPGNRTVYTSKHKWHAAAALKALHTYAPKFGDWKAVVNNCSTWVKGIVDFMKDDNKREQCECEPIINDFDRLSSFGASLGVELTYLKASEVKQPLVLPEADEPEEPADQKEMVETRNQRDDSPLEEPQEHRSGPDQSKMLTGSVGIESTEFNGKELESSMNELEVVDENIDDFNNKN